MTVSKKGCIEETSLMHTLILFTRSKLQGNVKGFFSENRISRVFIKISSKETIYNSFQLKLCNA